MIYNLQQTTRLSMTESDPDVVIVGGGPCGLALAIGMRQLGYRRVVVIERCHPVYGCGRPECADKLGLGLGWVRCTEAVDVRGCADTRVPQPRPQPYVPEAQGTAVRLQYAHTSREPYTGCHGTTGLEQGPQL